MNTIYRLIYSRELGRIVVASELASTRGGAMQAQRTRPTLATRLLPGAIALACVASPAHAIDYGVHDDASLRAAIIQGNTDSDPARLLLVNDVTTNPGTLPVIERPITIDTGAYTLRGTWASIGAANYVLATALANPAQITFRGTLVGADDPSGLRGEGGIYLSGTTLYNEGSITGGAGARSSSTDGVGMQLLNGAVLMNYGTVSGGASGNGDRGGYGVQGSRDAIIDNYGLITGGDGGAGVGGVGVFIGASVTGTGTLVNRGTIRGGTGTAIAGGGGEAVYTGSSAVTTIVNRGTLEGGTGAAAIRTATRSLDLINSGTIRAATGRDEAIAAGTSSSLALELQAGSNIVGNVVASTTGTTDVLRLGGVNDATFDVSTIGNTAQYRNFEVFEKTGSSVWSVVGTHAAPWTINGGTLKIGDGGTSGDLTGEITNNAVLAFDRSDAYTFTGTISGTGSVHQVGSGTITLDGAHTYTGGTFVEAGALAVNGSLCGALSVLGGGRLQGTGSVCDTDNAGVIAPGNSIGTLTINGNYTGNGGVLELEAQLGGDDSPADRLVVTGDTAGSTIVHVTNVGGAGAQTVEGIKVIDVGGASNGAFALQGDYVYEGEQAVVAGAYAYRLQRNGVSTPTDGDWYLRSASTAPTPPAEPEAPLYQAGAPVYESYAGMLQAFDVLGTLQQRVSGRSWMGMADATTGHGVWARVDASEGDFEPDRSTTGATYDTSTWKLEAGADVPLGETLTGGLVAHYGEVSGDVSSLYGVGTLRGNSYGLGATLTWRLPGGVYVDAQARATRYDSDLRSRTASRTLVDGADGDGIAASVEVGRGFAMSDAWSLTPQLQLSHVSIDLDAFTDAFGARVDAGESRSLVGRLGLSLDYRREAATRRTHAYGIANLYNQFEDGTVVNVAGTAIGSENESFWGGIGAGGSVTLGDGRLALYGELMANTGLENFGDSTVFTGTVGLRASW